MSQKARSDFGNPMMFWLGGLLVAGGVFAHLPMYWMGVDNGFDLSGMPMDLTMSIGMLIIPIGLALALIGLMPEGSSWTRSTTGPLPHVIVEDGTLKAVHWKVLLALLVAITVDVMKPATLGFVIPGMRVEYELTKGMASLVPLAGLTGTIIGSIVWGRLGDILGRRGAILLAVMMFMGTSICGSMPNFWLNILMCFLMGLSAGGMLPIAFALTAEVLPARHRGWMLVGLGGIGTAAGYIVASGAAAFLEPGFSWRSLWLIGLPTGAALLVLQRYIPESPRFLMAIGDEKRVRATLERFGGSLRDTPIEPLTRPDQSAPERLFGSSYGMIAIALIGTGLAWGLVNIGFLLWLPSTLEGLGLPRESVSKMLALSGVIALPGVVLVIPLYQRWSSFGTVVLCTSLTAIGLLIFAVFGQGGEIAPIVISVAMVLIASSGTIATLIPYSSEVFPLHLRSTGTGYVAAASKFGGLMGVGLGAIGFFTSTEIAAIALAVPLFGFAYLLRRSGVDTRRRTLEEIQGEFKARATQSS